MAFGRKQDDEEPEEPIGYEAPPVGKGWVTGFAPGDAEPDDYRVEPGDVEMTGRPEVPPIETETYDPAEGRRSALHPHLVDPTSPSQRTPVEPAEPRPITFFERRIGLVDLLIALLLTCIAFAAVVFTQKGFGYTWDEALYYEPARKSIEWVHGIAQQRDANLLKSEAVRRYWGERLDSNDPLHPEVTPLPKLLNGAALEWGTPQVQDPLLAMRLPAALTFGLTIALAYLLGALEFGRLGGMASAVAYGFMPRVFGHAHIAAAETMVTFFIAATAFFFLLSLRRGWLAPAAGLAFGLALAAKITAILLPLPLLIWGQLFRRRDYASAMFFLLLLAPVVALAVWPWLWHDSLRRFFSFLLFYTEHQSTAVMYMGRMWGYTHGPGAPWHYPWVITAISLPEWILLLAVLGVGRALLQAFTRPVALLWLMCAVLWLGFSSLSGSPKYDGERLFFPSFFFVALLAGAGFTGVFDAIAWKESQMTLLRPRNGYGPAPWAILVVLMAWGVVDMHTSHPNQLNYYNWIVGRPAGAYARGYETSYWHDSLNDEATEWMEANMKPGDRVRVLAMNGLAFEHLRNWGKLPAEIDFAPGEPPFDYLVMQVRQGFMGTLEKELHNKVKPVVEFKAQGVPRLQIFSGDDAGLGRAHIAMPTPAPTPTPTPTPIPEPAPQQTPAPFREETAPAPLEAAAPMSEPFPADSTATSPAVATTPTPMPIVPQEAITAPPQPAATPAQPPATAPLPETTPVLQAIPSPTGEIPAPAPTPIPTPTPTLTPTPAAPPAAAAPSGGIVITDSPQ